MKQETIERLRNRIGRKEEHAGDPYVILATQADATDILAVLEAARDFAKATRAVQTSDYRAAPMNHWHEANRALLALIDLDELRVLGGTK